MDYEVIHSDHAPKAIGPYSQAIRFGDLVYCAGQLGLDPQTGDLISGGIEPETHQALLNVSAVLKAASSSLDRIIKVTVFLADMNEFKQMNAVYGEFFSDYPPARSTVQVARLPRDARVEIEATAIVTREPN
jgi:2-iminobutanoate/2-iminopropanoate deaminase